MRGIWGQNIGASPTKSPTLRPSLTTLKDNNNLSSPAGTAYHKSVRIPISRSVHNMVVYALLIISKAGGLIYNRSFHPQTTALQPLSINDLLNLAGTFHGIHAISRTLCPMPVHPRNTQPIPSSSRSGTGQQQPPGPSQDPQARGIESLQTSRFCMSCYQTLTGIKFLLFTEPVQRDAETVLRKCHELYSDYVMKNPFYSLEMPIRCEKFERAIGGWVGAR